MKPTLTHNNFTINLHTCPNKDTTHIETQTINKTLHTQHVKNYINNLTPNKITNTMTPKIHTTEQTLTRKQRRLLAQLRAGKSPLLRQYLHKIDPNTHTSPLCPLCKTQPHNTQHLFTCTHIPTHLVPKDLWNRPVEASEPIDRWEESLGD
jgi:DNA-binding CsgD family transcriptional regulator